MLAATGLALSVCGGSALASSPMHRERATASESVLFAVQGQGGRLIPKGNGDFTLTLNGVSPLVVGFTDRPHRDTFNMPAARFFRSFWRRANPTPPAVALDLRDPDNRGDAVVLMVRNPRLHRGTLKLDARLTAPTGSSDLDHYASRVDRSPPRRFGSASLFFDTRPHRGGEAEAAPKERVGVDLLYVTGAKSGRLDRSGKGKYRLTLRGVRDNVVAFSDHPVDLSYTVPSAAFFGRWWQNLFSDSSPNGALDFLARSGGGDSVALELSNPRLKDSVLRLNAKPLERASGGLGHYRDRTLETLPKRFKGLSLFVDAAVGNPPNSSDCWFGVRNRTSSLKYGRYEAEGSGFRWTKPAGYDLPFDGVSAPRMEGPNVRAEGSASWAGGATQPPFGDLDRCAAKVVLNRASDDQPVYALKVTEYQLAAQRRLSSPIECVPLLPYYRCEQSVDSTYYHNCYYPTSGVTEDAYCTEEWLTTGSFVLCDEVPAFPPRHTCPSWVPPHDPSDDEPLARFRRFTAMGPG